MTTTQCKNGHLVEEGKAFCLVCGMALTRTCPRGHSLNMDDRFCSTCGEPALGPVRPHTDAATTGASRAAALSLRGAPVATTVVSIVGGAMVLIGALLRRWSTTGLSDFSGNPGLRGLLIVLGALTLLTAIYLAALKPRRVWTVSLIILAIGMLALSIGRAATAHTQATSAINDCINSALNPGSVDCGSIGSNTPGPWLAWLGSTAVLIAAGIPFVQDRRRAATSGV